MRMKLIIICVYLLTYTQANVAFNGYGDESFKNMCEFWGGANSNYKERGQGARAMSGDTCSMSFAVGMGNKETARRYCEENVPFHIKDVVDNEFETICRAEATLKCDKEWIQMFGRCYKIEKKMMTRDHALAHCKAWNKKATIAFMHREALPFRVRDYFTQVSRVWMDASETVTNDLIHNKGPHLVLAIDGYKYGLPNLSFARVPIAETAMALCEYTPDMTQAESNYLLTRYGEIYYPTIFTKDRAYVRSASSYQRDETRQKENAICKNILKPFLRSESIGQAADPSLDFLDALSQERDATIIRTAVYSGDASKFNRMSSVCTESQSKNYGIDVINANSSRPLFKTVEKEVWSTKEQPKEDCDGAYWSTGVVMSRTGKRRLETMSDARYAPIYCQTNFEKMGYGDCPDGFTDFWREERGQKWCHKFIDLVLPFAATKDVLGADKYCEKNEYGSFVSGFTNATELAFLDNMITKHAEVFGRKRSYYRAGVRVGVHRRGQCYIDAEKAKLEKGFNPDPSHPCSKKRIFEWGNGVAKNPPEFDDHWITKSEPNYLGDERCVEMLIGPQQRWGGMDGTMKLNDLSCYLHQFFFCGKEAPIISQGLQNQ